MPVTDSILPFDTKSIKVWVLAPYLESSDANIEYYYDYSQSIQEYTKTFAILGIEWEWKNVTMINYKEIIEDIAACKSNTALFPVVLNICDGDEVNGTPGISIIRLLDEKGLIFTGADAFFYTITTSKIPMKKAFCDAGVPTAAWEPVYSKTQKLDEIFNSLGNPVIVKPAVSGGSMGLGIKNIVYNETELKNQLDCMFDGYRGWNLSADGIVAESFISGNEYTVLIVGDYNNKENAIVYSPVERIFHPSLPEHEKILSFDRLWEIYEEESAMPNQENFYEYALPDSSLVEELKQISWDAYVATKGIGYSRVDLRRDNASGNIYVLEVNAQCGISEDENYTSIGAILRFSGKSFTELVTQIIINAFQRKKTT